MSTPLVGISVCMLLTNDVVRDARVLKEARSLASAGARVIVIGTGRALDPALFAEPFETELVAPQEPSRHPVWPVRVWRNLAGERAFDRRLEAAAVAIGADIVHANDLDTLLPGARAARRTGAALVYDAHEISTEGGNYNWWRKPLMERRERRLMRRAAAAITVNPFIAREFVTRYGVDEPEVVYNGSTRCVSEAQPVHGPVRLFFQGKFYADRNLEQLVQAMTFLRGKATLTFQGWSGIEQRLHELVDELDLTDTVKFISPCAPADVVTSAAEYDVGIINHRPVSLNHRFSSPNKLFDYLSGGLAIVASDLPVFDLVLRDTGAGITFEPSSAEETARVLEELVDDPQRISEMKRNAVASCGRYAWATQARILLGVYERVAAHVRARRG